MISRGVKKKPATSPSKPNNPKKKSKSKSKSKQKSQKFSPKDFLQALIDLQNTNCSTNKKKRNTTRDISSALTIATPALEKTISASKIRSKSSFSQYRKKCAGAKEPLTINLCAVITEQDNVQYTEKTARSSYVEEENQKNKLNIESNFNTTRKLNQNICAAKIQRAWRNYQTYKMVHQIYLKQAKYKTQKNQKKQEKAAANQIHIKICKPDFDKALRIKKEHALKKQERKQEQFWQTKKIMQQRCKEVQDRSQEIGKKSPILAFQLNSFESECQSNAQQESMIKKIKERQAQMLNQVINLIEKQGKVRSKEELINELIQKCENNKRILEQGIQQGFVISPAKDQFENMKQHSKADKDVQTNREDSDIVSLKSSFGSQSSLDFNYQIVPEEVEQIRIFDQKLNTIKEERIKKLQMIDDFVIEAQLSASEASLKKEKIYEKYEMDRKEVEQNKKQFIFSVNKLKRTAIQCQKSKLKQSLSFSKIRKSFSVGNTVLKQILSDLKIQDIEYPDETDSFEYLFQRHVPTIEINKSKALTNTPVLDQPASPSKKSESEQLADKNNTEVMKEYSEQIQELIEKQLLQEFVTSIFLNDQLYHYFKPYVEEIYQFRKVADAEIIDYMGALRQYLPEDRVMLARSNQKINPTSAQILRIIRDLEYETDEYELIIPEDTFKKYRTSIEKKYEQENSSRQITEAEVLSRFQNKQIGIKVYKLEVEKREREKKYKNFERDLKIMYMKSVFNCINEFLIEEKSASAFMNGRSSIGPGELSLAIKQYNKVYELDQYSNLLYRAQSHLVSIINMKCSIPSFKNYRDIEQFQKEVMKQIKVDANDNEFKWVNYMDEVLQIWQDISLDVVDILLNEACKDILSIFA